MRRRYKTNIFINLIMIILILFIIFILQGINNKIDKIVEGTKQLPDSIHISQYDNYIKAQQNKGR